jgi:hypothetical protein
MNPRTIATLAKLEKADWFSCVGIKDTEAATVLSSWSEAIAHCSSLEWENLCLEAFNQFRMRLLERSKARYHQWNQTVSELGKTTKPLVKRKIEQVVAQNGLPKVFEDTVQGDIIGACIEAEYDDVYPPAFYTGQAYWYVKGHFPCGWEGKFPAAKLIIY